MEATRLLLVFFIGAVSCHNSLPACGPQDLGPCINDVTKSYILATKGEMAASLPPDPASSALVGEALSHDIGNPAADLNKTCSTMANMDMEGLADCLVAMDKVCYSGLPADMPEMLAMTLPAMRSSSMGQSIRQSSKLCTPGCMKPNFAFERMTAMKACWKNNEAAVEAMLLWTKPQCGPVSDYMTCTWQSALGCDFLEGMVRLHLQALEEVITKCQVVLPAAATQEQQTMTSRASSTAAPGTAQVVFQALLMIAAASFIKAA